jgi:hypothetical protein
MGFPQPLIGVQPSTLLKPHMRGSYGGSSTQPGLAVARSCMQLFHASPVAARSKKRKPVPKSWKLAWLSMLSDRATLAKICTPMVE